jgi:hypothetical protein
MIDVLCFWPSAPPPSPPRFFRVQAPAKIIQSHTHKVPASKAEQQGRARCQSVFCKSTRSSRESAGMSVAQGLAVVAGLLSWSSANAFAPAVSLVRQKLDSPPLCTSTLAILPTPKSCLLARACTLISKLRMRKHECKHAHKHLILLRHMTSAWADGFGATRSNASSQEAAQTHAPGGSQVAWEYQDFHARSRAVQKDCITGMARRRSRGAIARAVRSIPNKKAEFRGIAHAGATVARRGGVCERDA